MVLGEGPLLELEIGMLVDVRRPDGLMAEPQFAIVATSTPECRSSMAQL